MKIIATLFTTTAFTFMLIACSPEIGSTEWCEKMDDKPKGDWSANETVEYAKSCVFRKPE